nr:metal ABC transporter ATP-binding protein [Corynebacterium lactis]
MTPVVSLRDAAFTYGGPATVEHVTAHVCPGEGLALIGANGSGKTTVLRGILGGVRLAAGEVRNSATRIAYVPQVADLDRTFPVTAFDVVAMGVLRELRPFQLLGSRRSRVLDALAKVGLAGRANDRFGNLSGGQQQRVLLARAIVSRPELVLLDEPFNGLDTENRAMLLNLLHDLKGEGAAIITSTHDLVLAEETCENTLIVSSSPRFGATHDLVPAYVG